MSENAIKVRELCGEYCIADADAKILADAIVENLNDEKPVTLDFEKVDTVLSAFFNSLFSHLVNQFTLEQISSGIKLNGSSSESVQKKYQLSLNAAQNFLEKPEEIRSIIRRRVNREFNSIDMDDE